MSEVQLWQAENLKQDYDEIKQGNLLLFLVDRFITQ